MSKTSKIIEKITQNLRDDRELRLDISHELQTHLDEAVEEYKASDYVDDAAIEQAIKDLGDPDELAQDLWQSNRSRMKLRAWCWWTARLTLLPACLILTLAFILTGFSTTGNMRDMPGSGSSAYQNNIARQWFEDRLRSSMTKEQRLIAFGDEQATDSLSQWKALCEAWPNEPLYQLNYFSKLITYGSKLTPSRREKIDQAILRGKEIDPDNGLYDLYRTRLVIDRVEYENDLSRSFKMPRRTHAKSREVFRDVHPSKFKQPQDQQKILQVMQLLKQVVDHDYLSMYEMDMLRHRMHQLPAARSIWEYFWRVTGTVPLAGNIGNRYVTRYVCVAAIEQAKLGHIEEALAWLDMLDRMQAKLAVGSEMAIQMLVVRSCLGLTQLNRVFVYDIADDIQARDRAIEYAIDSQKEYESVWSNQLGKNKNSEAKRQAGSLLLPLLEALPGYKVDTTPFRKGEYARLDRGMLSVLLSAMILTASLFSAISVYRIWQGKVTQQQPLLMWIGIMPLLKVLFLSLALPVIVFGLLAQTPLMGRQWNVGYSIVTNMAWYALLLPSMFILLWCNGVEALRKQFIKLGEKVPGRRSLFSKSGMFLLLLLMTGVCLFLVAPIGPLNSPKLDALHVVMLIVWLLTIMVALWFTLTLEIGWINGVKNCFRESVRSLIIGLGIAILLIILAMGVIALSMGTSQWPNMILGVTISCLPIGLSFGWWRMTRTQCHYKLFATSVIRCMSVVLTAGALAMVLILGPALIELEAHYANQMTRQSPILIDLEIERSNAKLLKEKWAAGEPTPPRRVPRHPAD